LQGDGNTIDIGDLLGDGRTVLARERANAGRGAEVVGHHEFPGAVGTDDGAFAAGIHIVFDGP
jgi:hypothetical protein